MAYASFSRAQGLTFTQWGHDSWWLHSAIVRPGRLIEQKMPNRIPFTIEELNPFQEWHHHGTSLSLEEASNWARTISKRQNVKVRIRNQEGEVIAIIEP